MTADPFPGEPVQESFEPFLMRSAYVPSDSNQVHYTTLRRDLEVEVPTHSKTATKPSKNAAPSAPEPVKKGRCSLAISLPKGRFHNGLEVPVVFSKLVVLDLVTLLTITPAYFAHAPLDMAVDDIDWNAFRPYLPLEPRSDPGFQPSDGARKDGCEYWLETAFNSVEPPPDGDGKVHSVRVFTHPQTIRFESGHLSNSGSYGESDMEGDFELPGYGWSIPFRDPDLKAWTTIAFVRAWLRISDQMPSNQTAWGGNFTVFHSLLARLYMKPQAASSKDLIHSRLIVVRNRGYDHQPPPYPPAS